MDLRQFAWEIPRCDGSKLILNQVREILVFMGWTAKSSLRCVGVFDTVGALGLPGELNLSDKVQTLFGFPDKILGEHIERAYQALALDEHRKDFVSQPTA